MHLTAVLPLPAYLLLVRASKLAYLLCSLRPGELLGSVFYAAALCYCFFTSDVLSTTYHYSFAADGLRFADFLTACLASRCVGSVLGPIYTSKLCIYIIQSVMTPRLYTDAKLILLVLPCRGHLLSTYACGLVAPLVT